MFMGKNTKYWLLAIFMLTLTIRLVLAFFMPNLTYDSYFHLRQVEHISSTGLPLYNDPLSYGGRTNVFLPLFHYLAAFFALILPLELVAKILPNLLIALIVPLVYLISKKLTDNQQASILSAVIAGFLPILYSTDSFTPQTLFLPLLFLSIYAFLNIKEEFYLYLYIFSMFCLSLTSSGTILILGGYLIYLVLLAIEKKRINRAETEVIIFSFFLYLWTQFLFYKQTLLTEGINFIWQNIPQQILAQYYPQLSLAQAIVLVGIIPFVTGIYVVYNSLFNLKNQKAFLLISFVISTTILSWLKLIEFKLSLSFFAIILAILFSVFYVDLTDYIKKTKFYNYTKKITLILTIILLLTIVPPALSFSLDQDTPTTEQVNSFVWLKQNTPEKSVVASNLREGSLVSYYGNRKNLMDDQFNLIKKVDQRFDDLNALFTAKFQTQALSIYDAYGINYIVITSKSKQRYGIEELPYLDKNCFELIYNQETKIYLIKCKLIGK